MPALESTGISGVTVRTTCSAGLLPGSFEVLFRHGGSLAGQLVFDVDMMPVNAAIQVQNTPSTDFVAASDVQQVIFSDANFIMMEATRDPQIARGFLTPAFPHG